MYVIQNILQKISVTLGAFAPGGLLQSLHELCASFMEIRIEAVNLRRVFFGYLKGITFKQ
jgi:hypothetical protein